MAAPTTAPNAQPRWGSRLEACTTTRSLRWGVHEPLRIIDLGRMAYEPAYRLQCDHLEEVLAGRDVHAPDSPHFGRVLLVEHDPVITVSRRGEKTEHLIATPQMLSDAGVAVAATDRGGDITYHGPGQLVVYPILDLNTLNLGIHEYMRLLESTVIDCCADFGVAAQRDAAATGVWVPRRGDSASAPAKICAMGVRVRRWVSMHGLALNVTTNLDHFRLIVPCGLTGRSVTSLQHELGTACPSMDTVKSALVAHLKTHLDGAYQRAVNARPVPAPEPR